MVSYDQIKSHPHFLRASQRKNSEWISEKLNSLSSNFEWVQQLRNIHNIEKFRAVIEVFVLSFMFWIVSKFSQLSETKAFWWYEKLTENDCRAKTNSSKLHRRKPQVKRLVPQVLKHSISMASFYMLFPNGAWILFQLNRKELQLAALTSNNQNHWEAIHKMIWNFQAISLVRTTSSWIRSSEIKDLKEQHPTKN